LGAVALNLLGYAFYEYLAGSYFEAHHNISMEGNMDPMFITIGSIIFVYGMANLYRHHTSNHSFSSGFKFGLWIRLLFGFGMGLIMHGTTQWMDLQAQIVNSLWCFVYYGITGGIMGWTFKKLQPAANAQGHCTKQELLLRQGFLLFRNTFRKICNNPINSKIHHRSNVLKVIYRPSINF